MEVFLLGGLVGSFCVCVSGGKDSRGHFDSQHPMIPANI